MRRVNALLDQITYGDFRNSQDNTISSQLATWGLGKEEGNWLRTTYWEESILLKVRSAVCEFVSSSSEKNWQIKLQREKSQLQIKYHMHQSSGKKTTTKWKQEDSASSDLYLPKSWRSSVKGSNHCKLTQSWVSWRDEVGRGRGLYIFDGGQTNCGD